LSGNIVERELKWRALTEEERKYVELKEKEFYNLQNNNFTV
jgi:hypothetical protein